MLLRPQAVPYAQDELVLLVPSDHELARRGSIAKCELYNLSFVSMNQGSSVQAAQEETLLQQGIKWHKLHTHMVRPPDLPLPAHLITPIRQDLITKVLLLSVSPAASPSCHS